MDECKPLPLALTVRAATPAAAAAAAAEVIAVARVGVEAGSLVEGGVIELVVVHDCDATGRDPRGWALSVVT